MDFEQLLQDLRAVVRDGEELLKVGVSSMRERALTTNRLVHEHPYQTVAIAFGVGVLVGVLAFGLFTRTPEEEQEYQDI